MGEGRAGWGEKNGVSAYRAHPKAPELLTPSLTTSLLGTGWKGKDRRPWFWVEGGDPGLNCRPRHLASGARPIRLNPLSPPVLQRGRHRAPVPVGDHQIPLSPKVLTSGTRGYKRRADQKGQAVGSQGIFRWGRTIAPAVAAFSPRPPPPSPHPPPSPQNLRRPRGAWRQAGVPGAYAGAGLGWVG